MMRTIRKKARQTPLIGRVVDALFSENPRENAPSIQAVLNNMTPNKNLLINAFFQIWQRGESITPTQVRTFVADRWRVRGTVDGKITYSKYGNNNGMLITNTSAETANSNVEQIIELDDRMLYKVLNEGIATQLRFNRTGNGDAGKIVLSIQLLDSSQNSLYEARETATNDGTSNVRTLLVKVSPEDIKDYESSAKYIVFRVLNENMVSGAKCVLHWAKMEYGIISTRFEPLSYSENLSLCEEYYAIRGINIRIDSSSTTTIYRYSIPFNSMIRTPSRKIYQQSGDITETSSVIISSRELQFNFQFTSTGARKLVLIGVELDAEIY